MRKYLAGLALACFLGIPGSAGAQKPRVPSCVADAKSATVNVYHELGDAQLAIVEAEVSQEAMDHRPAPVFNAFEVEEYRNGESGTGWYQVPSEGEKVPRDLAVARSDTKAEQRKFRHPNPDALLRAHFKFAFEGGPIWSLYLPIGAAFGSVSLDSEFRLCAEVVGTAGGGKKLLRVDTTVNTTPPPSGQVDVPAGLALPSRTPGLSGLRVYQHQHQKWLRFRGKRWGNLAEGGEGTSSFYRSRTNYLAVGPKQRRLRLKGSYNVDGILRPFSVLTTP
jgi:hypothetical protein